MKRYFKFFASILLVLCFTSTSCAQTKIDWKQIKNIPDTLEFKNVLLEHLLFKSAYQPVMESEHQGAIYYDNQLERLRVYENGEWRDLSVYIASDSIGAPLTILGYLQATDIYASRSAYIKQGVYASGTSVFDYLKVSNALKVPTVASKSLGVGSIYYDTTAKKLKVLNSSNNWDVVSVDVDSALSATSTNPVQNKVIYNKVDQIDADLINGLALTLQQSYNYANGIATQAYNYANSVASDAESASKNYADTQLGILSSYVSQQLSSGTSNLNVNSITAKDASFTNRLHLPLYPPAPLGNGLLSFDDSADKMRLTYYDPNQQGYHSYAIADEPYVQQNYVSNVATGTTNGTIAFTKYNTTYNVAVKGLGDAAFTNVASITASSSFSVQYIQLEANYYERIRDSYNNYVCQGKSQTIDAYLLNVSSDTMFLFVPVFGFGGIQYRIALKMQITIDGDTVWVYSVNAPTNTKYVLDANYTGTRNPVLEEWGNGSNYISCDTSTYITLPQNIFGDYSFRKVVSPVYYTRRSANTDSTTSKDSPVAVVYDQVCLGFHTNEYPYDPDQYIGVMHHNKNEYPSEPDGQNSLHVQPILIMFRK